MPEAGQPLALAGIMSGLTEIGITRVQLRLQYRFGDHIWFQLACEIQQR
jgi:hypothetical protein